MLDLTSLAYQPKSRARSGRPTKHVTLARSQKKMHIQLVPKNWMTTKMTNLLFVQTPLPFLRRKMKMINLWCNLHPGLFLLLLKERRVWLHPCQCPGRPVPALQVLLVMLSGPTKGSTHAQAICIAKRDTSQVFRGTQVCHSTKFAPTNYSDRVVRSMQLAQDFVLATQQLLS